MDTIIVIETPNRDRFQQFLQEHVLLNYAIVHCNSFFVPPHELPVVEK